MLRPAAGLRGFRISPGDSNWFAVLLDPADGARFAWVVEVFAPGGATPPNRHEAAQEAFFVLRGEGRARLGAGPWLPLAPGDTLLVPPGEEHVIENTGPGRLYCLTLMTPDEGFGALIRAGTPVELDAQDRAVLSGRL